MKTYLSVQDVDSLFTALESLRNRCLLAVLRDTGIRVSELISIEKVSIDLKKRLIRIRAVKIKQLRTCPSCHTKSGRRAVFCPGCGASLVEIPLEAGAARAIRRLVAVSAETAELLKDLAARPPKRSPWLFPSPKDPQAHLTRQQVYNIVRGAASRAGLDGKILDHPQFDTSHYVSPHKLRDHAAIKAFRADPTLEGLRVTAFRLGHSKVETTINSYLKMLSTEAEEEGKDVE